MSSRKDVIQAIAVTKKRLYNTQAQLNAHKDYWMHFIQRNKIVLLAVTVPAAIVGLRVITTHQGWATIKQALQLLVLSQITRARARIVHALMTGIKKRFIAPRQA